MILNLITAPTAEPITLAEAKVPCRIASTVTELDDLIEDVAIVAARHRCEAETGRALITQTWDLILNAFPDEDWIEIPKPPLQSVTYVKYYDTQGVLQTWAATNYKVTGANTLPVLNARQQRGKLSLAYGISWPSTYGEAGDVTIRFVCGYGAATAVPALLKFAMLQEIATMVADPENLIKGTIVAEIPRGAADIYWRFCAHATQGLD